MPSSLCEGRLHGWVIKLKSSQYSLFLIASTISILTCLIRPNSLTVIYERQNPVDAIFNRRSSRWLPKNLQLTWLEIWWTIWCWLEMEKRHLRWSPIKPRDDWRSTWLEIWLAIEKPALSFFVTIIHDSEEYCHSDVAVFIVKNTTSNSKHRSPRTMCLVCRKKA